MKYVASVSIACATVAAAQTDDCTIGGAALTAPRAVFDRFGSMVVAGAGTAGSPVELRITFPDLEPPPAGEHQFGKDARFAVTLDGKAQTGKLVVVSFGQERVRMHGEFAAPAAGSPQPFAIDLPCTAAPATIVGMPTAPTTPVTDVAGKPVPEDLVFCALGNTGTGDDTQRRIGQAIAKLAPTGPLDFVLLLGDNFLPRGVQKTGDEAWRRCFENAYPDVQLPVTFHAVLGDRDHLGNIVPQTDYGRASVRWDLPHFAYSFTATSHGTGFLFVGIDTTKYAGAVGDPPMRFVSRTMLGTLEKSTARCKIVFGHHSMHGGGPEGRATSGAAALRERTEVPFQKFGVDLYLAGGDHHLELLRPANRPVEVISGTGGGLVRSAQWSADSRFAAAVPGFTWFRYDGHVLEISFRDQDGQVLHVERMAIEAGR